MIRKSASSRCADVDGLQSTIRSERREPGLVALRTVQRDGTGHRSRHQRSPPKLRMLRGHRSTASEC